MNTKQQYIEYHHRSAFESNENPDVLARAGFTFASVTLLSYRQLDELETTQLVRAIAGMLRNSHNAYDAYMEFCLRLLLARDAHPWHFRKTCPGNNALEWLKNQNNGYACTGSLYQQLLQKRKQHVLYKANWSALAEAVLDLIEDGTPEKFEYWIHWFRKRHARYELFIFLKAIEFQTTKIAGHAR